MKIFSATFVKSVIGTNDIFENGIPQVVFIGRSNVGKSSVINSLTGVKGLAKTSSFPGRTQQINLFLINRAFYLVDLPGYGYAKVHAAVREQIQKMINWYLFDSEYLFQKVVLIIDAKVGPTEDDLDMCDSLEKAHKEIVIVANKIDKIKKDSYDAQMAKIKSIFPTHKIIPYSAEKKIGIGALTENLLVY